MIDIAKSKKQFKKYLDKYKDQDKLGFELKVIHTYKVIENAREIARKLGLTEEDEKLAELIALLHDIGRFEELNLFNQFESGSFNHADYGVKVLFEDKLIRDFVEDDSYDEIIRKAIYNHNKYKIESGLDDRELLHANLIRDADKLDNFRLKKEEKIEAIFPGIVTSPTEMEESKLSDKVYEAVLSRRCVDIHDRKEPLDYWICVLAFIFDIYFKETFELIKDKDYVNIIIDRFNYKNAETREKMKRIKEVANDYVDSKIYVKKR